MRLLVAMALVTLGCGGSKAAPAPPAALPVEVEAVAPRPVEEASEYVGTFVSRRSVQLLPRVSGYVRQILVKPGQRVKAGTVLLRIDARQEAAVLEQSSAAREQAETQLALARSTRARIESLHKEGIRSQQDYDNAVAEEQAARANLQAARANVRAQSVQVAYHEVTAPFDGRVGDIVVKIGDAVTPTTLLTQLDESERLEISVSVPLERAATAREGETPVEVLDAAGKPVLRATVFFIAPRPDLRTQLIEMRAAFENTGLQRSGQRARVRVIWRVFDALTVPTFAVTRQTGQSFVFVVKGGANGGDAKVERRPVTLGLVTADRWTVTEGLGAGERIAVTRVQALRDGQTVAPRPAAKAKVD
jgi:RND family efflux transporter MFP subunit